MNPLPRSWLDRLLELALGLVAAGLLLTWAWQLLRPLVPVLVITGGVVSAASFLVRRHRNW